MAAALFIVNNLLALAVAWLAADRTLRGSPAWKRGLATLVGFPVVVQVTLLVLGSAASLSAPWAAALLAAWATLQAALWRRSATRSTSDLAALPATREPADPLASALAVGLLGGFGGVIIVKTCLVGIQFITDDLAYHAPAVVPWLLHGKITLSLFDYHAHYPLNAELFSLWFMLPFRADGLASLGGAYWAALAVAAVCALSRAIGGSRAAGLLSAALLLASPVVAGAAVRWAPVDVAGPAMALAALAFAAPSRPENGRRSRAADLLYSGLASGYAAGCKVSLLPVLFVLLLWWLLRRQGSSTPAQRARAVLLFVVAAVLTGGYWYVRNTMLTGNPLFPAQIGPLAGPFGPAEQYRTKLISWIWKAPADLTQWRFLAQAHVGWPLGLFLLSAAGCLVGLWQWLRRSAPANEENRATCALLLTTGSVLLALYPLTPFSGTDDAATGELRVALRFLVAPFAIGLILFSLLTGRASPFRTMWWTVAALSAAGTLQGLHAATPTVVLLCGTVAQGLPWLYTRASAGRRIALLSAAVTTTVLLAVLALWFPCKQRLTDAVLHSYGDSQCPVGRAWRAVDDLPAGATVAWFGPAAYQYYPLFGRRWQLEPRSVQTDGTPEVPLYERWRRSPHDFEWWSRSPNADLGQLAENLAASGVQYVFVTKWNGTAWPPQQEALAGSGITARVYDDGYSTIWQINAAPSREPR